MVHTQEFQAALLDEAVKLGNKKGWTEGESINHGLFLIGKTQKELEQGLKGHEQLKMLKLPSSGPVLSADPVISAAIESIAKKQGISSFTTKGLQKGETSIGDRTGVVEPVKVPKLPRTGGLPEDTASRMARAREQGFTLEGFHGTGARQDFREFDPGRTKIAEEKGAIFVSDSPEQAGGFAESGAAPRILPVMVRARNPVTVDLKDIAGQPILFSQKITGEAIDAARQAGKDVVIIKNMLDVGSAKGKNRDEVADQIVVLDPSAIRSRFARFDPAAQGSADIMSANPASGGLIPALAQRQRESDAQRERAGMFGSLTPAQNAAAVRGDLL